MGTPAMNLHAAPSARLGAGAAHDSVACPTCRRAALRLDELEAATGGLKREVELGARRLQTVMCQLALAEERAGHRTLAGAIRSVASGQSNLSFEAVWALLGEPEHTPAASLPSAQQRLSARECEVLRCITEGERTPCIAKHLGITTATVEVHRRNIMRKLGLHTVAALTKYALREGLTSL